MLPEVSRRENFARRKMGNFIDKSWKMKEKLCAKTKVFTCSLGEASAMEAEEDEDFL